MKRFSIILFLLAGCSERTEVFKDDPRAVRSPCQCRAAGDHDGCYLSWNKRVYRDKTKHDDYDAWGFYLGEMEVPAVCREKTQ